MISLADVGVEFERTYGPRPTDSGGDHAAWLSRLSAFEQGAQTGWALAKGIPLPVVYTEEERNAACANEAKTTLTTVEYVFDNVRYVFDNLRTHQQSKPMPPYPQTVYEKMEYPRTVDHKSPTGWDMAEDE